MLRARETQKLTESGQFVELSGQYYQVLGHAWDHFRRDFAVVCRPLYHCDAKADRFEAHLLATSHYERFNKFRPVRYEELDLASKGNVLPGPFVADAQWGLPFDVKPVSGAEHVAAKQ